MIVMSVQLKQFQQRSGRTPSRSPAPTSRSSKAAKDNCEEEEPSSRRSISPVPEQVEYAGTDANITMVLIA